MVEALRLLDGQHRALDRLVEDVQSGVRRLAETATVPAGLLDALQTLTDHLAEHLDDEERETFPLVERHLSEQENRQVERTAKKSMGINGAAWVFPWILDGARDHERDQILGQMPAPLRLVYRYRWLPAYRRTRTAAMG